jgi:glycosyltransferase involved in cell wall biosynthesis
MHEIAASDVGDTRGIGLRIAMVTARYPPFMGGIETHVREVATRMAARGADITILTTDTTGELPGHETSSGLVIRRFPAHPSGADLFWSPALGRALRQGKYDLVHVQGVHTLLPRTALLAARRSGVPTVLTFHTGGHSSRVRTAIRGTQWFMLSRQLRKVERLVSVCEFETLSFSRRLRVDRGRFTLIRNGADALPIDSTGFQWSGSPLVLSIGRLEKYKGHHRVIRAMPTLLVTRPDARLVIAGHGPYNAPLRDLVAELRIQDSVEFVSFAPEERGQLGALIDASDVVVLMSEYEAHPVSVMEAVGLGKPVVVADTSGLSELGHAGLVNLVDLHATPSDVAAALLGAAPPDETGFGLTSWDQCADSLIEVYQQVLAGTS